MPNVREDSRVVERYRLERGGVLLGIVTRGEWDGHQASWHDWGWLEPAPGADAALDLLAAECTLHDEAVQLELAGGDPAYLLAKAAQLQVEFNGPGIVMVSLADGTRSSLDELHAEAGRIYWR
jgi:hypothetical protein